jgi:hypothetical protein
MYEVMETGAQASGRRYSEQDVDGWERVGGGCEHLILPIHYPPIPGPAPKTSPAISYT